MINAHSQTDYVKVTEVVLGAASLAAASRHRVAASVAHMAVASGVCTKDVKRARNATVSATYMVVSGPAVLKVAIRRTEAMASASRTEEDANAKHICALT